MYVFFLYLDYHSLTYVTTNFQYPRHSFNALNASWIVVVLYNRLYNCCNNILDITALQATRLRPHKSWFLGCHVQTIYLQGGQRVLQVRRYLFDVVVQCNIVQCNALQGGTAQYGAVQCTVGLCTAIWCSTMHCRAEQRNMVQCNALQSCVTQCSALQCTVERCNAGKQCAIQWIQFTVMYLRA